MTSETDISRAIQRTLRAMGHLVVRVQAGGQRGRLRLADEGTPDLWCSIDGGMWLEVKREGGRITNAQAKWHAEARARGVRVEVVRSVAEVVELIREVRSA